jgi:hypothetical protein
MGISLGFVASPYRFAQVRAGDRNQFDGISQDGCLSLGCIGQYSDEYQSDQVLFECHK